MDMLSRHEQQQLALFLMKATSVKLDKILKRMKLQIITRNAKVEVLENQWDKILESLKKKLLLQPKRDTQCEKLVEQIEEISNQVRREVLTKYVT